MKHSDVWPWLDPWPIVLLGRKPAWTVEFLGRAKLERLRVFWSPMPTAREAERRIRLKGWLGKDHGIASLVRSGHHKIRPVIVCNSRGVVIDGNHTLMALLRDKRWKGKALVFRMVKP